jgi:two-component system sensor histidine kinase DctS
MLRTTAEPVRRRLLWAMLIVLLLGLLGTAIVLARRFQESQAQLALETEAAGLVSDIRSGLNRNVQTLQALRTLDSSPGAWESAAREVLGENREITRLEWRDRQLRALAGRNSPFHDKLMASRPRQEVMHEVTAACAAAQRSSAPAFSPSQFWPDGDGYGLELMEMCVPLVDSGQISGYLIVSYSLPGLLTEMIDRNAVRGRSVALTEVDGTRLAIDGTPGGGDLLSAQAVLELPGQVMMLRLDSPRQRLGLSPWGVTGLVSGLSVLLLGVLALLGRDMRLRLRAERELAEALAFRKAMENSLVTGLRARDMQGRITYVNPAFCQMVGLAPEQLLGTGVPAPYWPPELVDEYQRRQAVRLAGQTLPREGFESVFLRPDGTRFPVLIIEAPLVNVQGLQTGWMSAILDLTEQRRVEALQHAAEERLQATARLASVGEMASLLSHELNQPLAAIASYATGTLNLLHPEDALPREDVVQAMHRIAEQAQRAGKVIQSVTDFVRRREQEQDLVRQQVHVPSLIEAIMPLVGLQARKQGIRVQVDVDPRCPDALCDRTMIEQVLLNLARNGMQAMPQDTPAPDSGLRVLQLRVRPLFNSSGKHWLEFSVADHGQGLAADVAARLFTPFFTTKAEGMGLGLSLCRTVVEQHGGALTHESAQPCGTVFRFTLPAA